MHTRGPSMIPSARIQCGWNGKVRNQITEETGGAFPLVCAYCYIWILYRRWRENRNELTSYPGLCWVRLFLCLSFPLKHSNLYITEQNPYLNIFFYKVFLCFSYSNNRCCNKLHSTCLGAQF